MLGNLSVHRRHNCVAPCASRAKALAFPAVHRGLQAALLAGATLFAARVAHGRTSCPITTQVATFAQSTSSQYQITITDGGPGDLDGTVNGSCETALELCRGTAALCGDLVMDDGKVHAIGGTSGAARTVADTRVGNVLESIVESSNTCNVARFALAAQEDAGVAFRFRIQAHNAAGRSSLKRSRVAVVCLSPSADRSTDPKCKGASCPAAAPATCGDGIVDAAGEQCDGTDVANCASGACTAACICAATGPGSPQSPGVPTCGDGARNQVSERCDGADDAMCPGACLPDCTCGTSSGNLDVAPLATATASSSMPGSSPNDAVDQVVDGVPGDPQHEWVSNGEGHGAWLRLTWQSPVTIDRAILHDRVDGVDTITQGALVADDDNVPVSTGPLAADGAPTTVMLGTRTITALTFMVMQSTGTHAGLSEIEVAAARKKTTTTTTTTSSTPTTLPGSTTTVPAPPATTTTLPTSTGPSFYISPSGSDSNAGTSPDKPWRTFAKAIPALQPGNTLVVADGTYTRTTTGLPLIDCNNGAHNGTSSQPITIRAANERKAFLSSDGYQSGFQMFNCSWWNVQGLHAASVDNTSGGQLDGFPFRFYNVTHVNARRLLGDHNNRMQNTHIFAFENSQYVLVEECEAYYYHRHGFDIWQSRFVTVRRSYANSMKYGALGCCSTIDNRAYGDEAYSLYGTSDSIVENSISENEANGYQIHGTVSSTDPSGNGGRRNRILGSISLNDSVSALVSSRYTSGAYHNARDNQFVDFVSINVGGNGLFLRGAAGTVVQNVTLYDAGYSGLSADGGDSGLGGTCGSTNPDGCSFTARNVLSVGNASYGVEVSGAYSSWLVESSNAVANAANYSSSETPGDTSGNIQTSQSRAVPSLGLGAGQCVLWAPAGSWLIGAGKSGANIGATIVNRYVDGTLTGTRLWDPTTGAFPCGAIVAGVNDAATGCASVHTRLNVNVNGCTLP